MTLAGKSILVLEDEHIIAFALEDMLLEKGARPQLASSVEQAHELLERTHFDGAILDVNIHGNSSYPVAKVIRERRIPFMFATGYGEALHPSEFADIPTISKPYNVLDIERLLAGSGA